MLTRNNRAKLVPSPQPPNIAQFRPKNEARLYERIQKQTTPSPSKRDGVGGALIGYFMCVGIYFIQDSTLRYCDVLHKLNPRPKAEAWAGLAAEQSSSPP